MKSCWMTLVTMVALGCGELDNNLPDDSAGAFAPAQPADADDARGGGYCVNLPVPATTGAPVCNPIPAGLPPPIRWWAQATTYAYATCNGHAMDNDVGSIGAGHTIVLPHDAIYLGDKSGTCFSCPDGAWGAAPVFFDTVTGKEWHPNHLTPKFNSFTSADVGRTFLAGSFVGVSGGATCETGYSCKGSFGAGKAYGCNGPFNCKKEDGTWATAAKQNSTAAHLCIVSPDALAVDFSAADPLPTCTPTSPPPPPPTTVALRIAGAASLTSTGYGWIDAHGVWLSPWQPLTGCACTAWGVTCNLPAVAGAVQLVANAIADGGPWICSGANLTHAVTANGKPCGTTPNGFGGCNVNCFP